MWYVLCLTPLPADFVKWTSPTLSYDQSIGSVWDFRAHMVRWPGCMEVQFGFALGWWQRCSVLTTSTQRVRCHKLISLLTSGVTWHPSKFNNLNSAKSTYISRFFLIWGTLSMSLTQNHQTNKVSILWWSKHPHEVSFPHSRFM